MNVYIFGLGEGKKYLDRCFVKEAHILGYIDNYVAKNITVFEGIPVIRQNELSETYDFVIITLMQYAEIKDQLIADGIERKKIISFFDFKDAANEKYWKVIDAYKWRMELMWKHFNSVVIPSIDNIGYELYADSKSFNKSLPKIMDAEITINILINERKCLARFGDNEFELMCGNKRVNYQDVDEILAERLKKVLNSDETNLLVAIADNYGSLERYTDDAARNIRMYLTKEVRERHMGLLDLNRQYYDAYLSRPYMIYRDKENAKKRFDHIKKVWNNEDVLIVEGEFTRFGVGSDLLKNAKKVERIIVPSRNAFSKYDEIKMVVCQYGRDKLILSILGPTATVLAHDLAKAGYWIIDIGQLDTEYEWFLRGANKRCSLKYKTVSEIVSYDEEGVIDKDSNMQIYDNEIVARVL